MTYREQLDSLSEAAIEKSQLYFDIGDESPKAGEPFAGRNADQLQKAYEEWKLAEAAYREFLQFVSSNGIPLNSMVPE